MESGSRRYRDRAYDYVGTDFRTYGRKRLVIYTGTQVTEEEERAALMTSLEALGEGWCVITNGRWRTVDSAVEAGLMLDEPVAHMYYDDVFRLPITDRERKIFMLDGGIFSPGGTRGGWNRESIRAGDSLLSAVADACIFLNHVPFETLGMMLDSHVDVALLRTALRTDSGRQTVKWGAPVIDSFSSWLQNPKCMAWVNGGGDANLLYL